MALSSEEIKPVAIAIIELHLSEHISYMYLVSYSVSWSKILLNKKIVKFHINLVEGFIVDLKTFLSLAMPS